MTAWAWLANVARCWVCVEGGMAQFVRHWTQVGKERREVMMSFLILAMEKVKLPCACADGVGCGLERNRRWVHVVSWL
jgi:hypothetical protein